MSEREFDVPAKKQRTDNKSVESTYGQEADKDEIRTKVDKERKPYESDKVWLARRTFLESHWGEVPLNNLRCLSQVFINVNMIGCDYNKTIMERIKELGAGIMDRARRLENEMLFVKASEGRAKAHEVMQVDEILRSTPKVMPTVKTSPFVEKLGKVKGHLLAADRKLTPLQLLNHGCARTMISWQFIDKTDGAELRLDDYLVFKRKFSNKDLDAKHAAVVSVVDSFLEGGEASVVGKDVYFGQTVGYLIPSGAPDACYAASMKRILTKCGRHLGVSHSVTWDKLEKAFNVYSVNIVQKLQRSKGWEQLLEMRSGDLILCRQILKKGDCVKPRVDEIIQSNVSEISRTLFNCPEIIQEPNGELLLKLN